MFLSWHVCFAYVVCIFGNWPSLSSAARLHYGTTGDKGARTSMNRLANTQLGIAQRSESKWWSDPTPHAPLTCPSMCAYCCADRGVTAQKVWNMFFQARTFKCILDSTRFRNFKAGQKVSDNHTCSTPEARNSDPHTGKSHCGYTDEEIEQRSWESLQSCPYTATQMTYTQFLGKKCALHPATKWMGDFSLGTIIDSMYFQTKSTLGGVCGIQTDKFSEGNLFEPVCNRSRPSEKPACEAAAAEDMCQFLEAEMSVGRLDKFNLAIWATATGTLEPNSVNIFQKPTKQPRILGKFKIPGWGNRLATTEVLEETDKPIDLVGGGFQCTISLLRDLPMEDDVDTPGRNEYVESLYVKGLGTQTAMSPRDSTEVNVGYFKRYNLYQQPLHFVIPNGEDLLSDGALSRLVFESIGAHRVEVLKHGEAKVDGSLGLSPLRLEGPGGDRDVLGLVLPDSIKDDARFVVRMEGLFNGVETRPSLASWGGNAFFGKSGDLLAITYNGATTRPPAAEAPLEDVREWDYSKFVFRSSLINTVTVFDHLVFTHMLASETLSIASQETLSVDHPLRLFFVPHVWGNLNVNFLAANTLFQKRMIVHRASPWADEGFGGDGATGKLWEKTALLRYELFETTSANYAAMREICRQAGEEMPNVPLFDDGILFHAEIKKYVSDYVHMMYKSSGDDDMCSSTLQADSDVGRFLERFWAINDNATPHFWPASFRGANERCDTFIALLAELIFLITGFHRHVGSVADFYSDARFASSMWKDGELGARPKQAFLAQQLAQTTNALLPRLTMSLEHLHDTLEAKKVVNDFAQAMTKLSSTVQQRNADRKHRGKIAFEQMNPHHVEFGVMV